MLLNKFATSLRKLAYALVISKDFWSCANLLWYTVRPKLWIAPKPINGASERFKINIRIKEGYDKILHLRRSGNDLSLLYDVLFHRLYFLPRSLLAPNAVHTIIDCGASVGISALYFASRYPNAKIYCVESDPEDYELLKSNTASEPRITSIYGAVVGLPTAPVQLSLDRPISTEKRNTPHIEVPAFTIAEICAQRGLQFIDLLKVDLPQAEDIFVFGEFLTLVKMGIIRLRGNYTRRTFDVHLAGWNFFSGSPQLEAGLKLVTFRKKFELL